MRPLGSWPADWADVAHEFDGHGLNSDWDDYTGEEMLAEQLSALYLQHGVEVAGDYVLGAWLDPVLVREGHDVEMRYVGAVQVDVYVHCASQDATGG